MPPRRLKSPITWQREQCLTDNSNPSTAVSVFAGSVAKNNNPVTAIGRRSFFIESCFGLNFNCPSMCVSYGSMLNAQNRIQKPVGEVGPIVFVNAKLLVVKRN